jgi:hypothetical protein
LRAIAARCEPLKPALQVLGHPAHAIRLLRRQIPQLARVVREVVQLGRRAGHELPVIRDPAAQRRPVTVQTAEKALLIKRIRRHRSPIQQRPQIAPEQRSIRVHTE